MPDPTRVGGTLGSDIIQTGAGIKLVYATETVVAGQPAVLDLSDSTHGVGNSYGARALTDNSHLVAGVWVDSRTGAGFARMQFEGKYENAAVESTVAINEELCPSTSTAGRLADTSAEVKQTVIAGAAAGNHTVTGILTTDSIISVLHLDLGANAETDLTSEFSITASDTINNGGGTDTSNDTLIVTYRRKQPRVAIALENAGSNLADIFLTNPLNLT